MKRISAVFIFAILVMLSCTDRAALLQSLDTDVDTTLLNFEYSKMADALHQAEVSNKRLLVYVASPFCKKCKQMERDVLPDTTVSNFIHSNFVCAKFYLKKGGSRKSKEYKEMNRSLTAFMVEYDCEISFPTFVILDSSGELIKKETGSMNAQELIDFGRGSLQ